MRFRFAAGALALAAAIAVPAAPAYADNVRNDEWYLKSLDVAQAQKISKGSGVTVAVIDTGVHPHPDLQRNLLSGISTVPGGSGDGRVDQDGHGTNVAALVAAHGKNNNDGALGIAPLSKILPIKAANEGNQFTPEALASGVAWATSHGSKVINMSVATGPADILIDAVQSAISNDVVVVAAVGNYSKLAIISYPAAIDGVLVVGATDRNGKHAAFSVVDKKVDICAPGKDITTAEPKNRYADVDGTSVAAPIVAGAAALVRAKFPNLSGPEVIHRLEATADDIGPPGRDDQCGYGELNIVKALTADVAPLGSGSGSAGTPSASASASGDGNNGYIDPGATTAGAQPEADDAEPASSGTPLILGVIVGLAVAGGVVALLVMRRRRGV